MENFSELLGENQNLKSYGSKTVKFVGDNKMHLQSATQLKMYKRTLFNISGKLSGIDKYFTSCYSANIFDAAITLNCEGNIAGDDDFQVKEFLDPLKSWLTSDIIYRIFQPYDLIPVSETITEDSDGETTLVHVDDNIDVYNKYFYNKSTQYKIYFPKVTRGGIDDESVDQNDDLVDVINQSKLYSVSISANDKIYTLNATSLT